jgi:hypothetical protein
MQEGFLANLFVRGYYSDSPYAGSIAGFNGDIITDCTVNGSVSASSSSDPAYGGGLVGSNLGIITNSTSNCSVMSSSSAPSFAGGLVGDNGGTITNCTAAGGKISAGEDDNAYRGGFIGLNMEDNVGAPLILTGNHNDTGVTPAIGMDHRKTPIGPSDDI